MVLLLAGLEEQTSMNYRSREEPASRVSQAEIGHKHLQVDSALRALECLKNDILGFSGRRNNGEYMRLDGCLTGILLQLDEIESCGNQDLAQARKAAAKTVEMWTRILESRSSSPIPGHGGLPGQRKASTAQSLKEIRTVLEELQPLQDVIAKFSGTGCDPPKRKELERKLTNFLFQLDGIEVEGDEELKKARKAAVRKVQTWISVLDAHALPSNDTPSLPHHQKNREDSQPNTSLAYKYREIGSVLQELKSCENDINQFSGSRRDRRYNELEHKLTNCLLKLDEVDSNGNRELMEARRAVVRQVQIWINILEIRSLISDCS